MHGFSGYFRVGVDAQLFNLQVGIYRLVEAKFLFSAKLDFWWSNILWTGKENNMSSTKIVSLRTGTSLGNFGTESLLNMLVIPWA